MSTLRKNLTFAILAVDGFEQAELELPAKAIREAEGGAPLSFQRPSEEYKR